MRPAPQGVRVPPEGGAHGGRPQAELALKVGVTRKTINTVENGVFIPSTVLARALGLTVEALFTLAGE